MKIIKIANTPQTVKKTNIMKITKVAQHEDFYNFLKSQRVTLELYHGTSLLAWNKMKNSGGLLPSQELSKDQQGNDPNRVFFNSQ